MNDCNEDRYTCIYYILLYESECSAVTPLMVLMHRIRLYDLAILNFSVFHEVSLKVRKFRELYVNFGEKR